MRIVWLRAALFDIEAIETYIEVDNSAAARRVEQRIKETVGRLKEHPHIGRPGRIPETRELVVSGTPYIVPYTVVASTVTILAVIHSARKWPDML